MERADCEEQLAPCQLQGCPPLAVIFTLLMMMLLVLLLLMMMMTKMTKMMIPTALSFLQSIFQAFETKAHRMMHFVLEERWRQGPALDTSGLMLADLLLVMESSPEW